MSNKIIEQLYIDENGEMVDTKDKAAVVKFVYEDGRIVFGIPSMNSREHRKEDVIPSDEPIDKQQIRTVAIDFDGVLHSYSSGWMGEAVIPDPPNEGSQEFVKSLIDVGISVVIFSTRANTKLGLAAMKEWLTKYQFPEVEIWDKKGKPIASVYIDDRAFHFTGKFPSAAELGKRKNKELTLKGGKGSGDWGHSGRLGKVGGSAPKSSIADVTVGDIITLDDGKEAQVLRKNTSGPLAGSLKVQITGGDGIVSYIHAYRGGVKSTGVNKPIQNAEMSPKWENRIGTKGRSMKGPMTRVYHGTSEEAARKIRAEGLKPAGKNRYGYEEEDKRPPSVYVTSDKEMARSYGEGQVGTFGANRYAIIEINVPANQSKNVKIDELDRDLFFQENNFRIENHVPSSWIKSIELYDEDDNLVGNL